MCFGGGISGFLNPLKLPLPLIDPGGSLVNSAVKATGVRGGVGALASFGSGLEGTVQGWDKYQKTLQPKYPSYANMYPSSTPAPQQPQQPSTSLSGFVAPPIPPPMTDPLRNTNKGLLAA